MLNRAPSGSPLLDDLLVARDRFRARMRPQPKGGRPKKPPSLQERLAAVDKFCYNLSRREMLRIKRIICKSDKDFRDGRAAFPKDWPAIADVQRTVARHFIVTIHDMLARRREAKPTIARHVAMYLCKRMGPYSLPEIGRAFRRDHTTVLHAVRNIAALIETDKELAARIETMERAIEELRE